jgi:hypothetical protein
MVAVSPPHGVIMVNTQFGAGTYESGAAMAPSRWLVLLLGGIAAIIFAFRLPG